MKKPNQNRIWKKLTPGTFFFLAALAFSVHSLAEEAFLTPPGLRPVKDPSLVIPVDYRYPNLSIKLPAYRDATGNPADGWSDKFVAARRFASNQGAWIFFRNSDLKRSVTIAMAETGRPFRFWPVGTILVIESYRENAFNKQRDDLIEIAVMSKIKGDNDWSAQGFYPANWTYARFTPDGRPAATSAKIRDCHQCHSIAFHFTGDLIFTHFP